MDVLNAIIIWAYKVIATWYAAAIFGGILIFVSEWRDKRRDPNEDDVRHAAAMYREFYGAEAYRIIGDHMLAASFAPDGRHKRFLKRVSAMLFSNVITDEDRLKAIDS